MLWFLVYRYSSSTIIQPGESRNAKSMTRRGFKYSGLTQPRKDRLCLAIIRTQHDLTRSSRHDTPANYKDFRCLPENYRPQQFYSDQAKAPSQNLIIFQPLVFTMPYITSASDGAQLFYRDYAPATAPQPFHADVAACKSQPQVALVFIHGWPMSSLMYDHLMVPLCETYRIRCVGIDRRGFGESDWSGANAKASNITYETFADDTIHILKQLKLEDFIFVAASMGCGETVLAWERSGFVKERCKVSPFCSAPPTYLQELPADYDLSQGFIWIGPSLPYPLQTAENPTAPSRELWDSIRTGLRTSRASFVHASLPNVFGAHAGTEVDAAVLARFERIVGAADSLALERCVQIISSFDFTDKLKLLTGNPLLVLQGDADQGMPYEAGAKLIEGLVPNVRVSIYEKAGHGLYLTNAEKVIEEILGFVKGVDKHKN
jgi:non-heme chloroperoxidase